MAQGGVYDNRQPASERALRAPLADDAAGPLLLVGGERAAAIPPTLRAILRDAADHLARERAVRLETFGRELNQFEAADILGGSVAGITQVIAEASNLWTIARRCAGLCARSERRRAALQGLPRLSEGMGLYDLEDEACPGGR